MCEKLGVARKTVTPKKQCSLVYWSSCHRVDVARRTQLNCRFNVTCRSFPGSARLNTGFNEATYIIEVVDNGFGNLIWEFFVLADDVVTALQIECARRVGQQLCIADDYRYANSSDFFFGYGFQYYLGTDTGWVTHRNADTWQNSPRSRSRSV